MKYIDLNTVKLKMKTCNGRADNTNRFVTLQTIAEMKYDDRKLLFWHDEFHPKTVSWLNREDLHVKFNEFNLPCDQCGYLFFFYSNNLGLFYECILQIDNEDEFNNLRICYFNELNRLYNRPK